MHESCDSLHLRNRLVMDIHFPRGQIKYSQLKRLAGLLLALGLVSAAFYSAPLVELFKMVLMREGSSHGLFVPLFSIDSFINVSDSI